MNCSTVALITASIQWRELGPSEQERYEAKAQKDRERYDRECQERDEEVEREREQRRKEREEAPTSRLRDTSVRKAAIPYRRPSFMIIPSQPIFPRASMVSCRREWNLSKARST